MSNLIKRFKEDLQLAGYAKRSIQSYTSAVLRLQRFYNKPLHDITEEQLRQYWLCCQLEIIFKAKFRNAMKNAGLFDQAENGLTFDFYIKRKTLL